ncbi:MAG: DMT family transporter [Alphaproteobacteria bacterium]|jgi:drug/metabolite transporter (DMT)-like permease|tara:strand:+ start:1346 stop:2218 length:873 start_codon:yes stop_codon:yes gene_type:complete
MSAFIYKSLSVLFFVLMSVCIKATGDHIPLFQVVFFRNFFALIPLFFVIYFLKLKISTINKYPLHLGRAIIGITAMSLFFISIRYVPLVEMQTISFSSVFFISILSVFFLGEKIGYRRIIAVIVGFIGVVIILNPGSAIFSNYSFLPLIASFFLSIAVIFLKKILLTNNNILSVWIFTAFCTVISLFFYDDTWIWPQGYDLIFMIASGFLGFIAQICLTKSFQMADASLLAPLDFSSVIWSFLIGYIFFQEFITLNVLFGGLIIIMSVSYIFYRERVLKKQIVLGANKQF